MFKSIDTQRQYHLYRYYELKAKAIEYLGGKCVICGSAHELEFDHIDPETKSYVIGKNMFKPWNDLVQELDKCQLLCHEHHLDKHKVGLVHGTLTGYKNYKCRCGLCKLKHNEHQNEYRYTKGLRKRPSIPGKLVGLAA